MRTVLPLLLIVSALGIGAVLLSTSPEVPKSAPPPVAAVVGVAPLEPRNVPTFVEAFGTVVAARRTPVQPEVSGRVVKLHPQLVPGGLLRRGEPLLEIDKADYEIGLAEATAQLRVAEVRIAGLRAGVAVLRSRARQVEVELEYLRWNSQRLSRLLENNQAGDAETRDAKTRCASQEAALSAIQAQIEEQTHEVEAAAAQIEVARSRVAAAQLDLDRTHVEVPFDAIVLAESVETGQLIGPQTTVATLAATGEFWVEAAVPLARLQRIRFSEPGTSNGSAVDVTLVTGDGTVGRTGIVLRPLGQLDPQGRMAQILVAIQDPLDLNCPQPQDRRTILIGSYVRLSIDAGSLNDVYAIPRYALRENSRVWVRDRDGKLGIRKVDIVWRRQEDVLVRDGFLPGDRLVTTHLASVVPGMPLDIREEEDGTSLAVDPNESPDAS